MKKLIYLIVLTLILGLVLTGCLLSNVGQVPTTGQSGITYLTKGSSSSLVGLWHFDEGIGSIANDSSGSIPPNNGTLEGDASWTIGKFGNALDLDGMEDYVIVDDSNSLDITAELTIEAWVHTDVSIDGSTQMQIVDKGEHQYKSAYMLMIYDGDLYGRVNKNNDTACIYTSYPNDGEWHHVAYTFKSGEQELYIDGSNVVSNTGSATITSNPYPLLIGRGVNRPQYCWNGAIDEVRIYNCALSPSTIKGHAAGIYGFKGLLPPCATLEQKAFKLGRTIPLKWQYTDPTGNVVDSAGAYPTVEWTYLGQSDGSGILIEEEDAPGESGLHYDSSTFTWIFNWQTKGRKVGTYKITITSDQAESSPIFEIELRK